MQKKVYWGCPKIFHVNLDRYSKAMGKKYRKESCGIQGAIGVSGVIYGRPQSLLLFYSIASNYLKKKLRCISAPQSHLFASRASKCKCWGKKLLTFTWTMPQTDTIHILLYQKITLIPILHWQTFRKDRNNC